MSRFVTLATLLLSAVMQYSLTQSVGAALMLVLPFVMVAGDAFIGYRRDRLLEKMDKQTHECIEIIKHQTAVLNDAYEFNRKLVADINRLTGNAPRRTNAHDIN